MAGAVAIDIIVESDLWKVERGSDAVLRRAINAAAAAAASTGSAELAIVLTDDSAMRSLNRQWRGIDEPTNVLSFPAKAPQPPGGGGLGDIVIAYETTAREAEREGKPFTHHLAHLAVHGFLHLLGYDHMADDEAEAMERLETAILARLDIADPYCTRDAGA